MSSSLKPHGLQHTRLPCPSLSPRVCPSSCPLHPWCHATISSCDALFSFYPQSFSASGSFPMSWLFKLGDKNIGDSASASVLPVIIQGWFSFRLTGLISLQSKGFSRVFSSATVKSMNPSALSLLRGPTLTYMTTGKTIALTIQTFVG